MGCGKKDMGEWRRRGDDEEGGFGGEDRRAVRRREAPSLDRGGGVEESTDSVNCQASISAVLTVSGGAAHWLEDNDADCWTAALLTCLSRRREGRRRCLFWGQTDGRTDGETEPVTEWEKMWREASAAKNKCKNGCRVRATLSSAAITASGKYLHMWYLLPRSMFCFHVPQISFQCKDVQMPKPVTKYWVVGTM